MFSSNLVNDNFFSKFQIILQTFYRIAQRKIYRWNRQSYGFYEPLYGVAVETFFIENEFCSDDSYAYNSCSKYDEFLIPSNQIANLRYSFISNKPTCRIT